MRGWLRRGRSRRRLRLAVGNFHVLLSFLLCAAGIVLQLFGFLIFVDGAFARARQVEDLPQIDVTPDFHPAITGVQIPIERVPKTVSRSRIILFVKISFSDPKIRKRVVRLKVERLLVLSDCVGKLPLLRQSLATRNQRAYTQLRARLQNVVVW